IALQSALPVRAQTIPPAAYGALRWRLVGPHRGGRVLAVAGVAGDPTTFYFGAVDGGVWRTRNAGVTWEPLFDDQPIASIGALALAPSDPNVIYVGTGEASIRSDITYGAGVYKSTDGGVTWTPLTGHGLPAGPVGRIGLAVGRGGRVYALIGAKTDAGLYRSDDGGATWRLAGSDPRLTNRNWYFCRVTVDPQ